MVFAWQLTHATVGGVPVIFLPTSPSLVPELGRGDSDSADLLSAARTLIDDLRAQHPVASISLLGSVDSRNYTEHTGSFRAWGAPDVTVGEGNYLAELVQRYVLRDCDLPIRTVESLTDPSDLVLYGIDGPAALSERAPLSFLPAAPARHQWCNELLSGEEIDWPAEAAALAADGIIEPEMWWLLKDIRPHGARVVRTSDAHGVGRYVAVWEGWAHK